MKVYSIQNRTISNSMPKSFGTNYYAKKRSFQGSDSEKEPKKNKLKECLIDICIGWVAWDVIKELYHYFSNRGKPPLP